MSFSRLDLARAWQRGRASKPDDENPFIERSPDEALPLAVRYPLVHHLVPMLERLRASMLADVYPAKPFPALNLKRDECPITEMYGEPVNPPGVTIRHVPWIGPLGAIAGRPDVLRWVVPRNRR